MSTDLRARLHQRGLRVTPQRQLVLEAIDRLGHATPDAVCAEVQAVASGVNLSTIYRTLELFERLAWSGMPTWAPARRPTTLRPLRHTFTWSATAAERLTRPTSR